MSNSRPNLCWDLNYQICNSAKNAIVQCLLVLIRALVLIQDENGSMFYNYFVLELNTLIATIGSR